MFPSVTYSYQPLSGENSRSSLDDCHTCNYPPSRYTRREKNIATIFLTSLLLSNVLTWALSSNILHGFFSRDIAPTTPYGMTSSLSKVLKIPTILSIHLRSQPSSQRSGRLRSAHTVHRRERDPGERALGPDQHRRRDGGHSRRVRREPRATGRTALPLGPLQGHIPAERAPQPALHRKNEIQPKQPPCPFPIILEPS